MPPKRKRSEAKRTFRFNAITLYATFPQCDTPKEIISQNILKEWGTKFEYWIVCNEKHQDGNTHSHVLIKFKSKIDKEDSHFADFLSKTAEGKKFHGNYQSARDVHKIITYIKKAGDYIDSGNLPEKKDKVSATVAAALKAGKSLREVDAIDSGYMMNNLKKIKEYSQFLQDLAQEDIDKAKMKLVVPIAVPNADDELQRLIDWCNHNFYQRKRPIREPQLWLKTPIRSGKTTWLACLQQFMRCYIVGYERESFDEYRDDKYDVIVFDEYKSQKKLEFLNSLIDGQSKRLMQLYSGQNTTKNVNLPVIFCRTTTPSKPTLLRVLLVMLSLTVSLLLNFHNLIFFPLLTTLTDLL